MTLLPEKIRFKLFDRLSLKTMRYVHAVSRRDAGPMVKAIYDQIAEDFFINGSLTSRSKVPNLLAAIWTGGREAILVDDKLDRTTKEAMAATLSSINDCPYCGEMLVSLVHAGERAEDAKHILREKEEEITDPILRERLSWVRAVSMSGSSKPESTPFTREELPEAICTIMAMSDINRFSHIVMDGSPVDVPFGSQRLKEVVLGVFGNELKSTHTRPLSAGTSLHFTPSALLPEDMQWASDNTRIAQAAAQWAATVEKEAEPVVPFKVKQLVYGSLKGWENEKMPMNRQWVEQELGALAGEERAIAKLALLLAKASYQIDDDVVKNVIDNKSEERFIRILAWCSFTAARYTASRIARITQQTQNRSKQAA